MTPSLSPKRKDKQIKLMDTSGHAESEDDLEQQPNELKGGMKPKRQSQVYESQ